MIITCISIVISKEARFGFFLHPLKPHNIIDGSLPFKSFNYGHIRISLEREGKGVYTFV